MKINNQKIVNRWDKVMNNIGCEHIMIPGELESKREYYSVEDGVTVAWMLEEAKYWLSCYYEEGNCRCDDRFIDEYCYKDWVSETGMLKRLVAFLEKQEPQTVVEWTK